VLHAFFKAFVFILTGINIHTLESQLLGARIVTLFSGVLHTLLLVISRMPFLLVASLKDRLLGSSSASLYLSLNVFACRTALYCTKLRGFFGQVSVLCSFFGVLSILLLGFLGFLGDVFSVLQSSSFLGLRILLVIALFYLSFFGRFLRVVDLTSFYTKFQGGHSNLGTA